MISLLKFNKRFNSEYAKKIYIIKNKNSKKKYYQNVMYNSN